MFRIFRKDVEKALESVLGYSVSNFVRESEHADLSCTVAFKLAKERERKPNEIAEEIVEELVDEISEYIGSVEAVNGYINFNASYEFLEDAVNTILDEDEDYGSMTEQGEVLIEHTSANPDGPLHIGHIRNSIIGDTLARIFRKAGFNVTTQYYMNDMGRQVALAVLGVRRFGLSDEKPDHAVAKAYIEINRLMEDNPEEKEKIQAEADRIMLDYELGKEYAVEEFRRVVETALTGIMETLSNLNIEHDEVVWESEFIRNGYVDKVLKKIEELGLLLKDGAWFIDLQSKGYEKNVVVRRENGTTLYITRDLAYHAWKNENFERFINILGSDHKLIGKQLSDILQLLGLKPPEIVFFEFVSLPEGSMSTRKGKFISADDLIRRVYNEAYSLLKDRNFSEEEKKEIARSVAVGALRFDFVRVSPEKPMTFDWKKALDFERQTASYIQYSHARACSIMRKAVEKGMPDLEISGEICTMEERKLILTLSKFTTVIERILRELRPNVFADYLMDVAIRFNDFYTTHPVLKESSEVRMHRLAIVDATRIVLKNGLELLGIDALEKM
ncbi:arginyl-tRNA synthetase [Archaeoglobus sulfaticallidus PM70-1]|uniref:Arginine--tRNA ligase n=1 Tax=Archaeoglobus sulfaticallidus PM70-1 TaxID=387631 RepID=N0BJA5_9EURY|nr:arginine--tRNA ligase [Archaeoglobus sulfaticallidus]AGK60531.1 arginyl-tRNA synthetase [Archaeoglobus sulfaticallidus PM70-1]